MLAYKLMLFSLLQVSILANCIDRVFPTVSLPWQRMRYDQYINYDAFYLTQYTIVILYLASHASAAVIGPISPYRNAIN